ncbi:DUF480 domain-containing protein [Nocardioides sp. Arc9.136]|uniref:DUF480 domain-containing protein n=1 Tax=Nocardioides sp. Arc9.136 TaxID=2996826 RepID=UPI002666099F|nr:DUF480 domain-containing protein [Nocardioides sp. Arc9.136]WKN50353.1 DUF480 domain-containing protein [Nocardioides sp. Arc9.136]
MTETQPTSDLPLDPPLDPPLSEEEQRVLGALLEKQVTVPASYPLTLSALRGACNQTSSREPVVEYDEQLVEQVGRRLKDRGLLRIVWSDTGRRTLKYHQVLDEVLGLAADERALVTVLLLRGPQAPGELRTRTERLHPFADRQAVEACLGGLAGRGLVVQLPRGRGERDARWRHLLGASEETPAPAATAAEGPVVLPEDRDDRVRAAYGAVAADYADTFADELAAMPFERWLLDRVAADAVAAGRPVVEVGSGPGHVTAYLAAAGADATGLDLAPEMVEQARTRFPDATYQVGDLRRLVRPPAADGWAAVLAWYSLIHLAPAELPDAVAALARPLAPGGRLVLALQTGGPRRVHRIEEWHGHQVSLDFVHHDVAEVRAAVEAAGLGDVEWYRRGPVAARGETTERLYLLAART